MCSLTVTPENINNLQEIVAQEITTVLTPSSLRHWARSILNKFSIKRSASYSHRPVISGPCGFVSDPYSTVLNDAQSLIPGVGLERTEAEHNSVSSKLSSFNGSGNNVLLLGNV